MSFLKTHKFHLIFLILITFLAYINVYQNEFVSDDIPTIVKNQTVGNFLYNFKSLSIFDIIHSINFLIGGLNPPVYHLTNILFHAGNVILVYILVGLLLSSFDPKTKTNHKWLSLASALLFATHPIHTEVVTWISGGPYAVYTFFLLLSFILFIHYTNRNSNANRNYQFLIPSLLFFLLALSTTQKAIIFPLIIFVYLFFLKKIKSSLLSLAGFFLLDLFFSLIFFTHFKGRVNETIELTRGALEIYNPLQQFPAAIGGYLKLLILPINLSFYHETVFVKEEFILRVILTIISIVSTVIFFKRSKILCFAALIFFISLVPVLSPFKIAWVISERYVYLGSIGFAVLIAVVINKIGQLFKSQELANALLLTILLFYLPLTLIRNLDWKSLDTLGPATIRVSPLSPMARNNMGDYYSRKGRIDEAIREFQIAVELRGGDYPDALHNLGNMYMEKQDATAAAFFYTKAISLYPRFKESHVQMGALYIVTRDYQKAKEYINKALEIDPNYSPAYNSLGFIAVKEGDREKARSYFQKALSLDPKNTNALHNLNLLK